MAEYIKREALDDFKFELMNKFIELCRGNDYNRLTLLKIGDTVDSIYDKYRTKPTADVVEVVHCGNCIHANNNNMVQGFCYCEEICRGMPNNGFCSYGERRTDK